MIRDSGCVTCASFKLVGHGREGRFYILASCTIGRRQSVLLKTVVSLAEDFYERKTASFGINISGTRHRTNGGLLYQCGSKSEYSNT